MLRRWRRGREITTPEPLDLLRSTDPIPLRLGKGSILAFADGHSQWWRRSDKRTIAFGMLTWQQAETYPESRKMQLRNRDIQRLQLAVWGTLGYKP